VKIGILTGGGDVPGLNPCIRSITLSADDNDWEVVGFRRGWQGVLEINPDDPASIAANSLPLTRDGVRGLDRLGGTILHTSRMDPRTHPQGDKTAHVLHVLDRLGVDAMVTLGGDGTLRFSAHLSRQGFPVVSIPKTMDNDVFGTDYCIGFSTAVSRSVEAINALRTTIESHERIGIVELFGRRSGETALLAGFLAQVDRTIIAEIPADLDVLLPLLARDKAESGANYAMCVISEGATIKGEAVRDDTMRSLPGSDREEISVSRRLGRAIRISSASARSFRNSLISCALASRTRWTAWSAWPLEGSQCSFLLVASRGGWSRSKTAITATCRSGRLRKARSRSTFQACTIPRSTAPR